MIQGNDDLNDAVVEMFRSQGGVRKTGPAPRGAWEREAMALLNRMKK